MAWVARHFIVRCWLSFCLSFILFWSLLILRSRGRSISIAGNKAALLGYARRRRAMRRARNCEENTQRCLSAHGPAAPSRTHDGTPVGLTRSPPRSAARRRPSRCSRRPW
jgi:hypothetical protein